MEIRKVGVIQTVYNCQILTIITIQFLEILVFWNVQTQQFCFGNIKILKIWAVGNIQRGNIVDRAIQILKITVFRKIQFGQRP